MNVDVEIYMNNLIKFFKENPNDLINLVPKDKEVEFYSKLRDASYQNYKKGEEIALTQNQIIVICAELHGKTKKVKEKSPKVELVGDILKSPQYQHLTIGDLIINTSFGSYSLN